MNLKIHRSYQRSLKNLPFMVGQRNPNLVPIALQGLRERRSPEDIYEDILQNCGEPGLDDVEVNRAVKAAIRYYNGNPLSGRPTKSTRQRMRKPERDPVGRDFVRNMVEAGTGATPDSLRSLSRVQVPADAREQYRAYLATLFKPDEYLCMGEVWSKDVRPMKDWLAVQGELPDHVITNPLSGEWGRTTDGRPSQRCKECVVAYRHALIEFDGLPLEDQYAFWTGVLASEDKPLLPVVSLVFSGGKSIHGLLRLDAKDEDEWKAHWTRLKAYLCNQDAPEDQRIDTACSDPSRLTRTAGARRSDKPGMPLQSLLYLAA